MALTLTYPDDTPLVGIALTIERGVPSAHVAIKIKNTGIQDVVGAFVALYAEAVGGDFVTTGDPVVDERMGRFQVTGQNSVATPGQEIILGVVQPLGHLARGLLPTIKPGDWILADFWLSQALSSSGGGAVNVKIEVANESPAYPLPFGVSQVGHGIDTGRKQARSFFVGGRETTKSAIADAFVHVAVGTWLLLGEEYADASIEDVELNQNDGAAAALASGQSYIAALTQGIGDAPTVTKGLKATSPTKPTPPVGELILAWVTVRYGASGSVIQTADISADLTYGRFLVVAPAAGLSAVVHAGDAVIADFRQVRGVKGSVVLTGNATNRIWLEWSGVLFIGQVAASPSAGAVKLAEAVTDGTHVTSLVDTRTYISVFSAGALEVKATGGSPDVVGVATLVFPDGAVTDEGSGVVSIGFPDVTSKAEKATLLTASEGVQRDAGTDLSTNAALRLAVGGLAADVDPDPAADYAPTFDVSAGVHKKVLLKDFGDFSLSKYVVRETPSGTINGSNKDFFLVFEPRTGGQEHLYLNGLVQDGGIGNDYVIDEALKKITFTVAPVSPDKLRISYFRV
jgi:hypothetical protein